MALVDYSAESPVWSYYARNLKNSILAGAYTIARLPLAAPLPMAPMRWQQ